MAATAELTARQRAAAAFVFAIKEDEERLKVCGPDDGSRVPYAFRESRNVSWLYVPENTRMPIIEVPGSKLVVVMGVVTVFHYETAVDVAKSTACASGHEIAMPYGDRKSVV